MNFEIKAERKTQLASLISKNKMVLVFVALVIVMSFASPVFLTVTNVMNVFRQISINAIMAIGMTIVMTSGSIDLSVGSILAVGGIITAMVAKLEISPVLAILAGLASGGILGVLNGLGIASFKIPPFIVTLAMMQAARGLSFILCDGFPITDFKQEYIDIGQGYWFGIPIPVFIMIIVAVLAAILMLRTKFGRYVYFVGGNEQASRISGINIFSIRVWSHAICGMLAGLGGVILTFRVASALPGAAQGYEMDAIAAAIIGGCALMGGISTIHGTLLGALILGIINNGMNLLGVTQYPQMIIKGVIIFVAVVLDTRASKKTR